MMSLGRGTAVAMLGLSLMLAVAAPATAEGTAMEKRFPQLTMDQLNDQQRALAEEIMKVALSGTYVTVAMLLNAAQEPVPPGKSPPLQPLPAR